MATLGVLLWKGWSVGLPTLQPFHNRAIGLEHNYDHTPFLIIFIIHEMIVCGYHKVSPLASSPCTSAPLTPYPACPILYA
jgi:hypothetical protein